MNKQPAAMAAALALLIAGCAVPADIETGPKQTTGAAVGAVGGAILGGIAGDAVGGGGKNAIAIGAGAALGGITGLLLGSGVGESLDRADRMYAERSWNDAMRAPVGEEIVWDNPRSGNSGYTVANRQGSLPSTGQICREYTTKIKVGGKSETLVGTACQNPDGTWSAWE